MARCVARTKDLERCRNHAESWSLFCRRHRWWGPISLTAAVITLTTIGSNLATMFGITFPNPLTESPMLVLTSTIEVSPILTLTPTAEPTSSNSPPTQTMSLQSTQDYITVEDSENLDFEIMESWIFFPASKYWNGQYSNDWASSGLKSYQIYILTDSVGSIYPGANTYGEIYQTIDLTGVSELLFDMNAYGDWGVPELSEDSYLSLEVWIDDQMVFLHERQEGIYDNQSVAIIGFTGIHRLTFRLRIHDDYNALPPGNGLYLDNLRMIRTGTTEQSQNDISNFKVLVAGENYMEVQVDYTYIGTSGSTDVLLGISAVLAEGSILMGFGYTPEQVTIGSGTKVVTLWSNNVEPGTHDIVAFEACFHVAGQHPFYCKRIPYTMFLTK